MDERRIKSISKLLSYVLRHSPESINLELDGSGWANVSQLLNKLEAKGEPVSMQLLEQVVSTNDKKRFAFNEDKSMIRANQGHSAICRPGLPTLMPPEYLYHGTAACNLGLIKEQGLRKMERHHVHLSEDSITAMKVGSRKGKAVVLNIQARGMHQEGFVFYLSENRVWLTDEVPPRFIDF